MPVQIFPREGSFGQTLGAGVGQGLNALSQQYAKSKQFERDLLRTLAPVALKQNIARQQQMQQDEQEAPFWRAHNIDPNASELEKKTALAEFQQRKKDLSKKLLEEQVRPTSITEMLKFGKSKATDDPAIQQLAKELGIDLAPYQGGAPLADQNAIAQGDVQQQLAQQQLAQQQMGQQDPYAGLTNEQSQQLSSQIAEQQPSGLLSTLGRALPIIGGGIGTTLGTGGGLTSLLNMVTPQAIQDADSTAGIDKRIGLLEEQKKALRPDSQEYKNADEYIDALKDMRKTSERRGGSGRLPEAMDIKEETIKPALRKMGVDITPRNWVESAFDVSGKAMPYFLNALSGGETALSGLKPFLKKTVGPAMAGELTRSMTGSDLLGDGVSGVGYFMSSLQPGAVKKAAEEGFKKMGNLITGTNQPAARSGKALETIGKIARQAERGIQDSPGAKRIMSVNKALQTAESAGKKGHKDVRNLYQIYKDMGNEYEKWVADGVKSQYGKIRDTLRDTIADWAKTKDPQVAKDFLGANRLWHGLANSSLINENAQKAMNSGGIGLSPLRSIFNMIGGPNAIRAVQGDLSKGFRYVDLLLSTPEARKPFMNAIQAAATGSGPKTVAALNKLKKHADNTFRL